MRFDDFPSWLVVVVGGGYVGWGRLGIKLKLRFSRALGCLAELRNELQLENKINVPMRMFKMLDLFLYSEYLHLITYSYTTQQEVTYIFTSFL